jgi:hypothetical protein
MKVSVDPFQRRSGAFTLAEILLALGLVALTILTLTALSVSTLKANRKSTYVVDASQVSMKLMAEVAERAAGDPGFWSTDYRTVPYEEGTHKAGRLEYQYRVFAQTLVDLQSGSNLGASVPTNRVKKMDIVVEWHANSSGTGQGKRTLRSSCLVNER